MVISLEVVIIVIANSILGFSLISKLGWKLNIRGSILLVKLKGSKTQKQTI
jgi:hypothetical protein